MSLQSIESFSSRSFFDDDLTTSHYTDLENLNLLKLPNGKYTLLKEFPFSARKINNQFIWESDRNIENSHIQKIIDRVLSFKQSVHINVKDDFSMVFSNDNITIRVLSSDDSPIYPKKANHVINGWSQSRTSSFDQVSTYPNKSSIIKHTYEKPGINVEKIDSFDGKTTQITDSSETSKLLNTFENPHKSQNSEQYSENSFSSKNVNSLHYQHSSYHTLPLESYQRDDVNWQLNEVLLNNHTALSQNNSHGRRSISRKVSEIYNVSPSERCCCVRISALCCDIPCPCARGSCRECLSDAVPYSVGCLLFTAILGTFTGASIVIHNLCFPSTLDMGNGATFAISYGSAAIWGTGCSLWRFSHRTPGQKLGDILRDVCGALSSGSCGYSESPLSV